VHEVRVPNHDSTNGMEPLPAATIQTAGSWMAHGRVTVGRLEAWICERCGYSELYASKHQELAALARQYPEQITVVDGSGPAAGPFR
jgi:hypothetical protein